MLAAIRHRGNTQRSFLDQTSGIAIGHVFTPTFRAPGHDAPNWHQDGDYIAALDGAIYNREDFIPEGQTQGYDDRDTGAAVEYLRQKPTEFPESLDGYFGMAIWDKRDQALRLVRDPLGSKPLYYYYHEGRELLIFASELKGVLEHPSISREIDRDALAAYLTISFIPAPLSIMRGVRKVYPGEQLLMQASGRLVKRRYWEVPSCDPEMTDLEEAAIPVRERFIKTVEKQVDGARPVGVLLSGGVDSVLLLAVLELLGVEDRHSFTIAYPANGKAAQREDPYWAKWAAKRFGANHRQLFFPDGSDVTELLNVLQQFDEPTRHANRAYGSYLLTKVAGTSGVDSCLAGNGASDAFGTPWRNLRKMGQGDLDSCSVAELILKNGMDLFTFKQQRELLTEPGQHGREALLELNEFYLEGTHSDDIHKMFIGAIPRIEMPDGILAFQDRVSFLNDVEIRNPCHDAELVTLTNRIPPRLRGKDSKEMSKAALRFAFKDILPREIVNRPKEGFMPDYWTAGQAQRLEEMFLSQEALERTGLFKPDVAQRVVDKERHERQELHKKMGKPIKPLLSKRTWALLLLQIWFERYMNGMDVHDISQSV
ncbi:asparagine synthase-related protein [bacterium]|nr:asparagine synthase-related protein [bacterium]